MAKTPSPAAKPGDDPDPSMDDILASIRRILDDDQAAKPASGEVLMLDPSMMVDAATVTPAKASAREETPVSEAPVSETPVPETPVPETKELKTTAPEETPEMSPPSQPIASAPAASAPAAPAQGAPSPGLVERHAGPLVAPEAAAAAANSVGALMRTLAAERSASVSRGGVTIEDIVREEMRPLLKAWLDAHLPPIVERAVQAEIERVVGRQTG